MSDWIEFHQALTTHRKTYALAGILGLRQSAACGMLAFLWCWCLDNAPSGDLTDVNPRVLARAADWPKKPEVLISALVAAGFVDDNAGRLTLHDWDAYAGRLMAKRAKNRDRMACSRRGHEPCTCGARARGGATHVQGLPTPTPLRNQHQHQPPAPAADAAQPAAAAADLAPPGDPVPPHELRCYRAYDNLTGSASVTPAVGRLIREWLAHRRWGFPAEPAELFEEACAEAAKQEVRKLAYVMAILDRWERNGRSSTAGADVFAEAAAETLARRKVRAAQ